MGGKASRAKGNRGENEVIKEFSEAGFHAERRGAGYAGDDLRIREFPDWYSEVRRRETLCIPAWCREIEEKAGEKMPLLIFRRSREPWRAAMRLSDLFLLMNRIKDGDR